MITDSKKMHFFNQNWKKVALFGLIGLGLGYAYYYFIGCYNGTCAISGNPYLSSGYGLGAGVFMAWELKKKEKEDAED